MSIRMILAAFALAMAACAQPAAPPSTPTPTSASAVPEKPPQLETQAACSAYGGEWRPICRMQKPACVVTFKDAGKSCSDSSDCSGRCTTANPGGVAPGTPTQGTCITNSDPCGCFQLVVNGKADHTLCAD